MGSAMRSNKLTIGVQPSWKVFAITVCSSAVKRCLNGVSLREITISKAAPNSSRAMRSRPDEIKEKKFLGEAEILLQQPVTWKTAVRIGENALSSRETDLAESGLRENSFGGIYPRQRSQRDTQRVDEQHFIERVNGRGFSAQIEAQRTER